MDDTSRLDTAFSGAGTNEYVIGVMRTMVEERDRVGFEGLVKRATSCFEERLTEDLGLRVDLFGFDGPHVTPAEGAYAPLDFVRIGLSEKLEQDVHFLLIVTEVDLSATSVSFALALPSQLTNVGVISTRRLDPSFWGDEPQTEKAVERLAALMFHTFGHLLNLDHKPDPTNLMYDVGFETRQDVSGHCILGGSCASSGNEERTESSSQLSVMRMQTCGWRSTDWTA